MKSMLRRCAAVVVLLCGVTQASAVTVVTTGTWAGLVVTITSPDAVITDTTFELQFQIDGSTLPAGDPVAFAARVWLDNSLGVAGATWSYQYISQTPPGSQLRTGALGDSNALLSPGATGRTGIQLVDPVAWDADFNPDGFSFLSGQFQPSVRWTLGNLVLNGDAGVTLMLDDGGITGAPLFNANVAVLAVPEPSPWTMLMLGLCTLVSWRRRPNQSPTGSYTSSHSLRT